jgi:hypothetical protein
MKEKRKEERYNFELERERGEAVCHQYREDE